VGARITGFAVALVIMAAALWSVARWVRETRDAASRVFIVSALVIYTLVWYRYSFLQQYGYAVFKMSSWLQFVLVPFVAYGFVTMRRRLREPALPRPERFRAHALVGIFGAYIALNVAACLMYTYNGTGRNLDTGYIINHFGVAGNEDYFDLEKEVSKYVKPDQSVGMIFTDSIRHYWTSYYLRATRLSILSHETLPGDDENLPDVETGNVVDYYGNVRPDKNDFFHSGASDQFYITWSTGDLNQDIVNPTFAGPPVWANGSFRLFRKEDARDILFTGRGFYRLEYFKPIKEYYFPRVIRWSADGGEFYLLHPSHPGRPYRLRFDALVGYEYPVDTRTLELWLDGKKFQELTVTHSARVLSAPFYPTGEIHKLVVRIKERNRPIPRELALWNVDIPTDYRRMNIAFANAAIVTPDSKPAAAPALGARIPFLGIHPIAERFDGLQLDGWLSERAQFTIPAPAGASKVQVALTVPGNLGFTFPYVVKAVVNGREHERRIAAAGDATIELPLQPGEPTADVTLLPTQSVDLHEEAIRHKVIRRSVRLDAVTFH
jgi:hypothetical protein